MAFDSVVLTKVSVDEPQDGMVVVTINMTCTGGGVEVINQDFTGIKKNHVSLATVRERLRVEMQAAIDEYKREQVIFTSQALDNAIADLQNSLVG